MFLLPRTVFCDGTRIFTNHGVWRDHALRATALSHPSMCTAFCQFMNGVCDGDSLESTSQGKWQPPDSLQG
jgi:hypothetical protein